jgi:electron transfer flavoprotein beta subunit
MDAEKGVLVRVGSDSIMNPWDPYAIEVAVTAAVHMEGKVTVFTMGPPQAEKVLREAVAMGVNEAILLCDSAFSGADVYATSYTLSRGLIKAGPFDLVLCGQQTTDGDTAQTPYSLAAFLDIPMVGWVKKIEKLDKEGYSVFQEISGGTMRVAGSYPVLLSVGREVMVPRVPTVLNRLKAQKSPIVTWNLKDLDNQNPQNYGLKGSPTRVKKIYIPSLEAKHPLVIETAQKEAAMIFEGLKLASRGTL